MARFRTRRFEPTDEDELNQRYVEIMRMNWPDFSRSLDLMRWLWYQAPGGSVESWVIETENPDGSWRIIGHHGLCPVRFTFGDLDLLCAKTVNTFLLPEFRTKFLYLRFEQQCLAEAHSHFDATYSNGPGTARMRKALGYTGTDAWLPLEHCSDSLDLATKLFSRVVHRVPRAPFTQMGRAWAAGCAMSARKPSFEWTEYSPEEARQSQFFSDFWQQARTTAGMTPRRDAADLAWRFWQRPGSNFVTLVHEWAGGARAYCIVDVSHPILYYIVDMVVTPPRPDLLDAVLDALFLWRARRGALSISIWLTSEGQPPELMEVFFRRMKTHPLQRFRPRWEVPRYLSPRGRETLGGSMPRWNITQMMIPL